jgi:hypothetical protein
MSHGDARIDGLVSLGQDEGGVTKALELYKKDLMNGRIPNPEPYLERFTDPYYRDWFALMAATMLVNWGLRDAPPCS